MYTIGNVTNNLQNRKFNVWTYALWHISSAQVLLPQFENSSNKQI